MNLKQIAWKRRRKQKEKHLGKLKIKEKIKVSDQCTEIEKITTKSLQEKLRQEHFIGQKWYGYLNRDIKKIIYTRICAHKCLKKTFHLYYSKALNNIRQYVCWVLAASSLIMENPLPLSLALGFKDYEITRDGPGQLITFHETLHNVYYLTVFKLKPIRIFIKEEKRLNLKIIIIFCIINDNNINKYL